MYVIVERCIVFYLLHFILNICLFPPFFVLIIITGFFFFTLFEKYLLTCICYGNILLSDIDQLLVTVNTQFIQTISKI